MKEKFASSPLVELIAEVRWDTGNKEQIPVFPGETADKHERFFTSLKENLEPQGYVSTERIVPLGFPLPVQNPVIRFKKNTATNSSGKEIELASLYQAGVGIFTINGLQPYSSWDEFKIVVKAGVEGLISTGKEVLNGGFKISLRYIDLFDKKYTGDMTHREFMSNVLGIDVTLPQILSKFCASGDSLIPRMQVVTPLDFGIYQIQFAEAEVGGSKGFLMESVVSINEEYAPDVDNIMTGFSKARDVIHEGFVDMTKSLHESMGIIKE
jgi:uncharacterized protein (TIGR04255 family)